MIRPASWICSVAISLIMAVQAVGGVDVNMQDQARGNTAFAMDLYQKLCASRDGNVFFSPFSISAALAMTYGGARGETEKQMAQVLHFPPDQKQLHSAFAALQASLNEIQEGGKVKLCVANSLWPEKEYRFRDDYLSLVRESYGVSVKPMDYKAAAEPARKEINKWVEDRTNDKIRNLIQPGVIDALTRLILVNAIYFKGSWAEPFKSVSTLNAPFLSPGKSVQAPLMNQRHEFRYVETETEQVLELPYQGNQLSMLVLLPKQKDGLPALEKNMNAGNIGKWVAGLAEQEVIVFLPKLKMTSQFSLNQSLIDMGMADAFSSGKADFSGMDGSKYLFISAAIHKAFVEVNEEGTEAAAATAVVMSLACAMPTKEPAIFRADHPFIFLIRVNSTGSILFIGRVTDPTAVENAE